jgi:hypothetical protein
MLADLVQQGPGLMCSKFVANMAAGLACNCANTWAAELHAELQFMRPDQV